MSGISAVLTLVRNATGSFHVSHESVGAHPTFFHQPVPVLCCSVGEKEHVQKKSFWKRRGEKATVSVFPCNPTYLVETTEINVATA